MGKRKGSSDGDTVTIVARVSKELREKIGDLAGTRANVKHWLAKAIEKSVDDGMRVRVSTSIEVE